MEYAKRVRMPALCLSLHKMRGESASQSLSRTPSISPTKSHSNGHCNSLNLKNRKKKAKRENVECSLCPRKGGALKQSENGKWTRLCCSKWKQREESHSKSNDKMESEMSDQEVTRCSLCQDSSGYLMKCGVNKSNHSIECNCSFHVLCGLLGGGLNANGDGILCRQHIPILQSRGSGGVHAVTPYFKLLKMSKTSAEIHRILCILQHRQCRNRVVIQDVIQRIKGRLETLNPIPSSPGTPDHNLIVDGEDVEESGDLLMSDDVERLNDSNH